MLALNGTRIYPDFYRPFAPHMTKSKLEKFQELEELPNVYQNWTYLQPQLLASGKRPVEMRGCWNSRASSRKWRCRATGRITIA